MTVLRRIAPTAIVAAVLGGNIWLAASRFIPTVRGGDIEYRFLGAPISTLVAATIGALAALLALHAACARYLFPDRDTRVLPRNWADTAYIAPLALFALNFLSLANLVPLAHGWVYVWSYLTVDLRYWLAGGVGTLFIAALNRRAAGALWTSVRRDVDRRTGRDKELVLEMAILLFAVAFACLSSPLVRFDAGLLGDEPKYLRYCENIYQGHAFDLSRLKPIDGLPMNGPSALLQNVTETLGTIPGEWTHVREDLGALIRGGLRRPLNRARYLGGYFVAGKDGGVYQAHSPGFSILLMPAYYIDRHFLNWQSAGRARGGAPDVFPEHLLVTSLETLLLYSLLGVVVFRLILKATGERALSFGLALVTLATPPVAAFAFQFYPEVAAGIIITVVTRRLLYERDMTPAAAGLAGFSAGYLTWLHVRFLALVAIFLVWGAAAAWKATRSRIAFIAGGALSLGAYCAYAYHATGSPLPTAFYDAGGQGPELGMVGPGLFAFAFDGTFGLLAHAPILLVAGTGAVALVARAPSAAWLSGLLILAEFGTAASKDFRAALTSPGRFVVAVMPLVALLFAEAVRRFRASCAFRSVSGFLLIISLQTAWIYNRYHLKHVAPIVDRGVSGWRLNVLFPDFHGQSWHEAGFTSPLLPIWVLVTVAACLVPYAFSRRRAASANSGQTAFYALLAVVLFGLSASIFGRLAERQFEPSYVMLPQQALATATDFLRRESPSLDLRATKATTSAVAVHPPESLRVTLSRKPRMPGEPFLLRFDAGENLLFEVVAEYSQGHEAGSGLLTVDYGDGTTLEPARFASRSTMVHAYARPGRYHVRVNLLAEKRWVSAETEARVSAPTPASYVAEPLAVDAIDNLPADLQKRPPALTLSRIRVAEGMVCVDLSGPAQLRLAERSGQIWLATQKEGQWEARLYGSFSNSDACVRIPVDGVDKPAAAGLRRPDPLNTGVLVALPSVTAKSETLPAERSALAIIWWPSRQALVGSPIVFYPQARSFFDEVATN